MMQPDIDDLFREVQRKKHRHIDISYPFYLIYLTRHAGKPVPLKIQFKFLNYKINV